MGGAAFILLKTRAAGEESAKQAEIRLAVLLKILQNARFWASKPGHRRKRQGIVAFSTNSAGYG